MVIVVIGVLWLVILTPFAVRSIRSRRADKSIENFSAEHRTLREAGYTIQPVRTLDDDAGEASSRSPRAPLRVVRSNDPVVSDDDMSWDEWSRHIGIEDASQPVRPVNPYAAYKATPSVSMTTHHEDPLARRVSMKVRRTRIGASLAASALILSLLNVVTGASFVLDVAVVAWVGLVLFAALALVSVSLGYLDASSLRVRAPRLATVTTLTPATSGEADDFYDAEETSQWGRDSARRALG